MSTPKVLFSTGWFKTMDISSLMIAIFHLDSRNLAPRTGSTQGIWIWNKKLRFLKMTVRKLQINVFKIEKKWVIREKKMVSTVFKITGWNLVFKLILGRELRISCLIWRFWIVNASNQGIKSQKFRKEKNGLFNVYFEAFVAKTNQNWFRISIQRYEIRL